MWYHVYNSFNLMLLPQKFKMNYQLNCQIISKILIICYIFLQDAPEHINLKVLGQDNAVVQFKIKKHTPLKKLMNAYCERTVSI